MSETHESTGIGWTRFIEHFRRFIVQSVGNRIQCMEKSEECIQYYEDIAYIDKNNITFSAIKWFSRNTIPLWTRLP